MKKFLILFLMVFSLLIVSCGGSDDKGNSEENSGDENGTGDSQNDNSGGNSGDNSGGNSGDNSGDNSGNNSGDNSGGNGGNSGNGDSGSDGGNGSGSDNGSSNTGDEEEDNRNNNDDPREDAGEITYIHLKGTSIEVEGKNATVDGTVATITASGVYEIDGTLNDGQIVVNVDKEKDKEMVHIVFNGISITNSKNAPFAIMKAKNARIFTAKGTQNTLTDTANYVFDDPTVNEPNAALYSKDDLKLAGEGTLTVNGNYNDGIASKDDLDINGGTIVVNAKDDGIRGKDSVVIRSGNITVTSGGDGIKSDNTGALALNTKEDEEPYDGVKGYVKIKSGSLTVNTTNGDGIHAISYITIEDGTIDITAGGGSQYTTTTSANQKYDGETSLKGIKASVPSDVEDYVNINAEVVFIKIIGGKIKVNSRDDGIHCGGNIYMAGGETEITTDDDGIHADNELQISNGTINVINSYEGFEAWYLTAKGGITSVYGRDDGWNAAGGSDSSGSQGGPGDWGGGFPGGGGPGGESTTGTLVIEGGFHYIKTGSGDVDGLDSNGDLTISGGVVVVECQLGGGGGFLRGPGGGGPGGGGFGGMGGTFDAGDKSVATITTPTVLGFSPSTSQEGQNFNVTFNTNSYYGNANIAFKPTISGSYIQATSQPSQINDVSGYTVQQFPNGVEVYYKK